MLRTYEESLKILKEAPNGTVVVNTITKHRSTLGEVLFKYNAAHDMDRLNQLLNTIALLCSEGVLDIKPPMMSWF